MVVCCQIHLVFVEYRLSIVWASIPRYLSVLSPVCYIANLYQFIPRSYLPPLHRHFSDCNLYDNSINYGCTDLYSILIDNCGARYDGTRPDVCKEYHSNPVGMYAS